MLRPALLSVIEQSYAHIEIIFVDNGSTDGSRATAEEIAKTPTRPLKVTICSEPSANNARNFGYRFARGDFVQWMDADDALDRNKIALQVAALEHDPSADIAYGVLSETKQGNKLRLQRIVSNEQRML
jgi:CDP-glycerol glycerophosphotransferase